MPAADRQQLFGVEGVSCREVNRRSPLVGGGSGAPARHATPTAEFGTTWTLIGSMNETRHRKRGPDTKLTGNNGGIAKSIQTPGVPWPAQRANGDSCAESHLMGIDVAREYRIK